MRSVSGNYTSVILVATAVGMRKYGAHPLAD